LVLLLIMEGRLRIYWKTYPLSAFYHCKSLVYNNRVCEPANHGFGTVGAIEGFETRGVRLPRMP